MSAGEMEPSKAATETLDVVLLLELLLETQLENVVAAGCMPQSLLDCCRQWRGD